MVVLLSRRRTSEPFSVQSHGRDRRCRREYCIEHDSEHARNQQDRDQRAGLGDIPALGTHRSSLFLNDSNSVERVNSDAGIIEIWRSSRSKVFSNGCAFRCIDSYFVELTERRITILGERSTLPFSVVHTVFGMRCSSGFQAFDSSLSCIQYDSIIMQFSEANTAYVE